jgi:hypothetical protein
MTSEPAGRGAAVALTAGEARTIAEEGRPSLP